MRIGREYFLYVPPEENGGENYEEAQEIASKVCDYLEKNLQVDCPTVEQVQDAVEKILIEEGHASTAKAYILYRAERTQKREMNSEIMQMYIQL